MSDALFPACDGVEPVTLALRRASVAAGHVLWHTWANSPGPAREWLQRSVQQLQLIAAARLPHRVEVSVPEGYAYYGVYPEHYLEAAKDYHSSVREENTVVCLGLRSIGSSLSAAVAAALEELGRRVTSWTLRPRGHPFCRSPRIDAQLRRQLLDARDAHFLIIDEGPGISGSSFGGTIAMLRSLEVPKDRIALFPSWDPDGSTLRSAEARQHWPEHRRFSRTFEQVWLEEATAQVALSQRSTRAAPQARCSSCSL